MTDDKKKDKKDGKEAKKIDDEQLKDVDGGTSTWEIQRWHLSENRKGDGDSKDELK